MYVIFYYTLKWLQKFMNILGMSKNYESNLKALMKNDYYEVQ